MNNFISFQMAGGLGNILFSLATAYSLAIEFGLDLRMKYDHVGFLHTNPEKYRCCFLKAFEEVDKPFDVHINEVGCEYERITIPPNCNALLLGYFQSEKYFLRYRKEICDLILSDTVKLSELEKFLLDLSGGTPSVSLHVRRGNYLFLQDHHVNLPMDYYEKALSMFPDHRVLIFSDDILYCRNLFQDYPNVYFVEGGENLKTDIEEMYLMSLCNHNIIANSTFSWWGAWLNQHEDKKVIAPKMWYGPAKAGYHTRDLIPNDWIQI